MFATLFITLLETVQQPIYQQARCTSSTVGIYETLLLKHTAALLVYKQTFTMYVIFVNYQTIGGSIGYV
jgi:hypothetical protein